MNIKGVFQIWMNDGTYHEIPEGVPRLDPRGLQPLPRLRRRARRHLTGGIGKDNDWTLTIVRTELGPRDHQPDDRRRSIDRSPGRLGPGGHRAHAQARCRWGGPGRHADSNHPIENRVGA
jgi:coenzyme F420 hydrogenase subunit beta